MNNTWTDPRDGHEYRTVEIGGFEWLGENLAYKVPGSGLFKEPGDKLSPEEYVAKYGRLYTWEQAMESVPSGWRLPMEEDWDLLELAAGGRDVAGKSLKAAGGWNSSSLGRSGGTDSHGFSALPGGYGVGNSVYGVGNSGYWWSSTEGDSGSAYGRGMYYDDENVGRLDTPKNFMNSVRLVREN
jgi:uncharacterized protein (TIGR02145 family)